HRVYDVAVPRPVRTSSSRRDVLLAAVRPRRQGGPDDPLLHRVVDDDELGMLFAVLLGRCECRHRLLHVRLPALPHVRQGANPVPPVMASHRLLDRFEEVRHVVQPLLLFVVKQPTRLPERTQYAPGVLQRLFIEFHLGPPFVTVSTARGWGSNPRASPLWRVA